MNLARRLADYYARQSYASLPADVAAKGAERVTYMLMLALKGACQTVIGTRTAGIDALSLAADLPASLRLTPR